MGFLFGTRVRPTRAATLSATGPVFRSIQPVVESVQRPWSVPVWDECVRSCSTTNPHHTATDHARRASSDFTDDGTTDVTGLWSSGVRTASDIADYWGTCNPGLLGGLTPRGTASVDPRHSGSRRPLFFRDSIFRAPDSYWTNRRRRDGRARWAGKCGRRRGSPGRAHLGPGRLRGVDRRSRSSV